MYSGVNASDGIGIGVASVAIEPDLSYTPKKIEDTEAEKARYVAAREAFMEMTNKQIANMQAKGLEKEAGILNAHIEFAEDDGIIDSVTMAVAEGMCAEQAVDNAYTMYYDMFSQMEDELFRERDERASLFSMSTFFESWRFGQPQNYMNDNTLFTIQSKVVRDVAEKGPAVVIGRCADYILRDMETLDVFITAPLEFRIRRVMEREKLQRDEAENLIRRKDRTRATYYNYFTFGSWGAADNYDLCIDSSILGIEGTAEAIIDFGRKAGRIHG